LKKLSLTKAEVIWSLVFLSLPLNFLAISGVGNIYLTTIVVFLSATLVFALTKGHLLFNKYVLGAIALFMTMAISTMFNTIVEAGDTGKDQLVFTIIHLQLLLAFMLGVFMFKRLDRAFIFDSLLLIIFLFSLRLFIDDIDNAFNLSAVRGLRIEALFAGGANNFGLIVGIGFLINFFFSHKGIKRTLLGFYFLIVIVLTMSRGALFGVIFTLFVTAAFDTDKKTMMMLMKISFAIALVGIVLIFAFEEFQQYFEKFSERFLSLFTGDATLKQASSGRELIIGDLYDNHMKHASILQWLFGHGFGSINFNVNGYPYESSHNILIDILFRNGLLILLFSLLYATTLILGFLKNRGKEDLCIFSIFVFLHFELLVNPFLYAAQTGWIYTMFLALFIYRNRLLTRKRT